jgi:hypothetical protein
MTNMRFGKIAILYALAGLFFAVSARAARGGRVERLVAAIGASVPASNIRSYPGSLTGMLLYADHAYVHKSRHKGEAFMADVSASSLKAEGFAIDKKGFFDPGRLIDARAGGFVTVEDFESAFATAQAGGAGSRAGKAAERILAR